MAKLARRDHRGGREWRLSATSIAEIYNAARLKDIVEIVSRKSAHAPFNRGESVRNKVESMFGQLLTRVQ